MNMLLIQRKINKPLIIKIVFHHLQMPNVYRCFLHFSTLVCCMFFFLHRKNRGISRKITFQKWDSCFLFFLKELSWVCFGFGFALFNIVFFLGAPLWIYSENQGLVLVAPAYGIDKLYFDGYTFKVSFYLCISLCVEKFPQIPLNLYECKSIQWQSQICAGPNKDPKRR